MIAIDWSRYASYSIIYHLLYHDISLPRLIVHLFFLIPLFFLSFSLPPSLPLPPLTLTITLTFFPSLTQTSYTSYIITPNRHHRWIKGLRTGCVVTGGVDNMGRSILYLIFDRDTVHDFDNNFYALMYCFER